MRSGSWRRLRRLLLALLYVAGGSGLLGIAAARPALADGTLHVGEPYGGVWVGQPIVDDSVLALSYDPTGSNFTCWALTSGNLPPGTTMVLGVSSILAFLCAPPGVGEYLYGTPTQAGTYSFTMKGEGWNCPYGDTPPTGCTRTGEAGVSPTISVFAPAPPTGTTNSGGVSYLPGAQRGVAYSQALGVTGGKGPYIWFLTPGSLLPPGLTLSPNGTIIGTPTTVGYWSFSASVEDSLLHESPSPLEYTIAVQDIVPTSATLPAAAVGQPYGDAGGYAWFNPRGQELTVGGENGGYTWSLASGSLPPGLSLNPAASDSPFMALGPQPPGLTQEIAGTPTAAGTYSFTVQAEAIPGEPVRRAYSLPVFALNPPITARNDAFSASIDLPMAEVGAPYTQQLSVTAGGTAPYAWSVVAGNSLPPGLSLDPAGLVSGTPSETTVGNGKEFTQVQVSDGDGSTLTTYLDLPVASGIFPATFPAGVLGQGYGASLQTDFGTAPYTWSVSAGSLPPGLALGATSYDVASLSGTPTAVGSYSFTLKATDATGAALSRSYTLPIWQASGALPGTGVGRTYAGSLGVTGGIAPYTWAVSNGHLPPGLNLDSVTGQVYGVPTQAGDYAFNASVTDSQGNTAYNLPDSILVEDVYPGSLPLGAVGASYSQSLTASGGTGPITWSVTSGSLPAGLTLDASTGVIGGTPTAVGSSSFTVQETDANRVGASRTYTLPVWQVAPLSLPEVTSGSPVSQALTVTGGLAPYTWSVPADSNLAAYGYTLSPSGTLAGAPQGSGVDTFDVQVTDSSNPPLSAVVTVTQPVGPPIVAPLTSLPDATVGTRYAQSLALSGGAAPYTWSWAPPGQGYTLPPGLTLDPSNGVIGGTPTAAGDYPLTVTATDAGGQSGSQTLLLHVNIGANAVAQYVLAPSPVAGSGALNPGGTYTLTVTAELADGTPVGGAPVDLSFSQAPGGGTATAFSTGSALVAQLSSTPVELTTGQNGHVTVIYVAPATLPASGTDTVTAASPDGSVTAQDSYVFASQAPPTGNYTLTPNPIAVAGSLTGGQQVPVTVTTQTVSQSVYLSFAGLPGGGTAAVNGAPLTMTPQPFTPDANGQLTVVYTAPSSLPASGTDSIGVSASPNGLPTMDSYDFAVPGSGQLAFSPSPIAAAGSLRGGQQVPVTLTTEDGSGMAVSAAVYLSISATGGGTAAVGTTALTPTPQAFTSDAQGQLTVTYSAPAVPPFSGTDTLTAANAAGSASAADTYTFAGSVPTGNGASWPACGGSVTTQCYSLQVDGGAPPAGMTASVDFNQAAGSLSAQIQSQSSDPNELYGNGSGQLPVGAHTVALAVYAGSFDGTMLVSTGQVSDFTNTVVGGNHVLTITASPAATSWSQSSAGCSAASCPSQADVDYRGLLLFDLSDLSAQPAPAGLPASAWRAFIADSSGMILATNAQFFDSPTPDPQTKGFRFEVGAPHLTHAGAPNTGEFTAFVPNATLRNAWGLNPATATTGDFRATINGFPATIAVAREANGFAISSTGFHYSLDTVEIAPATTVPPQTGGLALAVSTTTLPNGAAGTPYTGVLGAVGGTMPHTWSLSTGSLPAGLSLNPATGVISGVPTTTGTSGFTVQVTDSSTPMAQTATAGLSITVSPSTSVSGVSFAPNPLTGGATSTWTASFTTSGSGALAAGQNMVLYGPSGTIFASPAGDYTVNGTVATADIPDPTNPDSIVVSAPVAIANSQRVTVVAREVTNPVAGSYPAGDFRVNTGTDQAQVDAASGITFTAPATSVPTVTGVSPASGLAAGGTAVTVTGTNLSGVTAVKFGATAATRFTVTSDTSISATSPAGSGSVDVTADAPGGNSVRSNGDEFTYQTAAPPTTQAVVLSTMLPAAVTGQLVPITVLVTGESGVPQGNQLVNFAVTGSGILSSASASTDGAGVVTVYLTDATAESITLTATAGGTGGSLPITFTAPPGAPEVVNGTVRSGSLRQVSNGVVLNNSTNGGDVVITPPDSGSGPQVSGISVELTTGSTSTANTVSGEVSASVYSTTDATTLLSTSNTIQVVAAVATTTRGATFVGSVVSFTTSGTAATQFGNDTSTSTNQGIEITLPFNTAAVPLGANPEIFWLDAQRQWTNAGVTILSLGDGTVTALVPHLSLYTVVAVQGSTATSESAAATPPSAEVNASVTVTATVLDQNNQPMSGVPVSFSTTLGRLSAASGTTNASGQAGVTLTSTAAGSATVTAAVTGISAGNTVRVSFAAPALGTGGGRLSPVSPATSVGASVDSAGGTLVSTDGSFSLTLPAGSVPTGSILIVSTSSSPPAGAQTTPASLAVASPYVTLSGATLSQPLVATIKFDDRDLATLPPQRISVYVLHADGSWHYLPSVVNGDSGTVKVNVGGPTTLAVFGNFERLSDIPDGYWAGSDIATLVGASIAGGFPDGTFRPDAPLTRAQFVKLLALTLGLTGGSGATGFTDVATGAWFAPYVAAAVQAGWVQGVTANSFAPDAIVTREQMAVLLARALKLTGGGSLGFGDAASIDGWAAGGVQAAVAAGYLAGFPDGSFQPQAATTRAQAAKVLEEAIAHLAPGA